MSLFSEILMSLFSEILELNSNDLVSTLPKISLFSNLIFFRKINVSLTLFTDDTNKINIIKVKNII